MDKNKNCVKLNTNLMVIPFTISQYLKILVALNIWYFLFIFLGLNSSLLIELFIQVYVYYYE